MHPESESEMSRLLGKYCVDLFEDHLVLLDVGSRNLNGAYVDIVPDAWRYIGFDIESGNNVDVVVGEYNMPSKCDTFDIVLSGQTLEHVRNPFRLMIEIARVMKVGAYLFVCAPFVWAEHRCPVDCFRYLPDGMRSLAVESGLVVIDSYLKQDQKPTTPKACERDCWLIARK